MSKAIGIREAKGFESAIWNEAIYDDKTLFPTGFSEDLKLTMNDKTQKKKTAPELPTPPKKKKQSLVADTLESTDKTFEVDNNGIQINGFTEEELDTVIFYYTDNYPHNKKLRKSEGDLTKMKPYERKEVYMLDEAIEKRGKILTEDTVFYRGLKFNEHSWTENWTDLEEKLNTGQLTEFSWSSIASIKEGAVLKQFALRNDALSDSSITSVLFHIDAPKGTKLLKIQYLPGEHLLPRNTTYYITEVKKDSNNPNIVDVFCSLKNE